MTTNLYAIQDCDGRFMYVGQTKDPIQREFAHFSPSGRFYSYRNRFKFAILRKCEAARAPRIETQIIEACKNRGQCSFNNIRGNRTMKRVVVIDRIETRERFNTYHEAANKLGCSRSSINYALNVKHGRLDDETTLKKVFVNLYE